MQSRKGQINRLLTSIMASMVVLSAMASVELLRHTKGRALAQAFIHLKHIGLQLQGAHFSVAHLPQNRPVAPPESLLFTSLTIPPALLLPEIRAGLHVRSPGCVRA